MHLSCANRRGCGYTDARFGVCRAIGQSLGNARAYASVYDLWNTKCVDADVFTTYIVWIASSRSYVRDASVRANRYYRKIILTHVSISNVWTSKRNRKP